MSAPRRKSNYEVHTHHFVSGPRSRAGYGTEGKWRETKFSHSHRGGSLAHAHPHTGPASYTIDKDAWFKATGLRGGGRKKFTEQPTGEQLPLVDLEENQKSFEVIIGSPTPPEWGTGPGTAPIARMILGSRMRVSAIKVRPPARNP
jgi:hypothetical protein